MKILKMTATFGALEGAVLALTDGLNLLEAPNEGGKSTWCAFLRAMLYGIPTKERDRAGYIAEKNRYQPWSGSPMEGAVELEWNGKYITLRRFQKGSTPFGGFEAVDTETGEPVSGLTAENAGETLVGVPREVFERSAFVGQSGVPVDADPELEKRIAALVSSGEEDVSFSQTQRRLKDWQNRRRHNKSGLIPKLEGELETLDSLLTRLDRVGRALAEARGEREALEAKRIELEAEQAGQRARLDQARRTEYEKAVAELSRCRAEVEALQKESGPLPEQERLRGAQGDLAFYNTLGANLKVAEHDLESARGALAAAEAAAADPVFEGMTADGAWAQASEDRRRAEAKRSALGNRIAIVVGLAAAIGLAVFNHFLLLILPGLWLLGAGVLEISGIRRHRAAQADVLARYGAERPEDITRRAEVYREKCRAVESAQAQVQAVTGSMAQMKAQREGLFAALLALVKPFAPEVSDVFGVSAAVSKGLSLDERRATAQARLEGAQKLVSSIPAPTGEGRAAPEGPVSEHTPQQTAAMLAAVQGELVRAQAALSLAQGERDTLGDPVSIETRRGEAAEELFARREEYAALALALEVLEEANGALRSRFSPALNQSAGEYFKQLTGGKYEDVSLTREFEALAREAGAVLPRRSLLLSRGTADQLYLAVRLAVCRLALPAEVPLVLDDALSDFDDRRMGLALDLLRGLGRQVLLFTCQSRERAYLNP